MASNLSFLVSWGGDPSAVFTIRLTWSLVATPDCLKRTWELVSAFCAVGAAGGFPADGASPLHSSFRILDEPIASGVSQVFRVHVQNGHENSFLVLRNVLAAMSAQYCPINQVVVTDDAVGREDTLTWEVVPPDPNDYSESYPPESPFCTLDVEEEEPLDYSKSRRCLVEFAHEISEDVLEELRRVVGAWSQVMEAGGFSPPVRPAERALVSLDTINRFDEQSIEIVFSVFDASEEGWNCLLNLLDVFSSTRAHIETVILE